MAVSNAPKNFGFLDSYRGLAAIAVVCSHSYNFIDTKQRILNGFLFGVNAFFELSAFLLTYRLIIQYENAGNNLKKLVEVTIKYMVVRFFRIYVPFVCACFFFAVFEAVYFGEKDTWLVLYDAALLRRVLIMNNTRRHGHLWTISIEVFILFSLYSFLYSIKPLNQSLLLIILTIKLNAFL